MDRSALKKSLAELTKFMGQQGIIIDPLPRLVLQYNPIYADQVDCPTAHYSPVDKTITLQTAGRHIKDVLRSYAHEMVHHDQHCQGMFSQMSETNQDPQYAQKDPHLREMEKDAYLRGNMVFRDWEDSKKGN